MNCYLHPDTAATAFCRSCGRPLCALCQRLIDGTIYCQDHVPAPGYAGAANPNAAGAANPYFQPPPAASPRVVGQASPGLAFVLGWIPGVGAIYNGQYVKGLIHVVIFALIVSILNSDISGASQAFLGIILGAFVIYMPFEAYHTARLRQIGQPVEEWSSLTAPNQQGSRAPVGAILLIVIGVLFLLDTLRVIEFSQIGRFWPVILIVVGAWMLYSRVSGSRVPPRASYPAPGPFPAPGTTTRPANHPVETPHER
jgi:hypothetical protein